MIGQHKSIEVVNIHWFCNSSLLLEKKIRHKTTKIPVLQKLTHMLNCKINSTNGGTFSKSAGKFFWVFFLVQGASVMSK